MITRAAGEALSQAAALAAELWPGNTLDNTGSIAFHLAAGFAGANRIVCFVKSMGEDRE